MSSRSPVAGAAPYPIAVTAPTRSSSCDPCRVEAHAGRLGREVDGRVDAVELVELALDPRDAAGARHSLDLEGHRGGIGVRGHASTIPPGGTSRLVSRVRGPERRHRPAAAGAGAPRPVRLRGSALRDRAGAPDRDGVRPGRPAVRRAGDRPDRRRGRRQREAARARTRVPRAARARLERPTPLRLVARAPGQPEPGRQDPARATHAAQGSTERPPPAGQRRRRRRRAPLPRIGIDVRRLQGEGREERDDPLGPPGRPRPAHRREGPAQPVRARGPTGDRSPVRRP